MSILLLLSFVSVSTRTAMVECGGILLHQRHWTVATSTTSLNPSVQHHLNYYITIPFLPFCFYYRHYTAWAVAAYIYITSRYHQFKRLYRRIPSKLKYAVQANAPNTAFASSSRWIYNTSYKHQSFSILWWQSILHHYDDNIILSSSFRHVLQL